MKACKLEALPHPTFDGRRHQKNVEFGSGGIPVHAGIHTKEILHDDLVVNVVLHVLQCHNDGQGQSYSVERLQNNANTAINANSW